MSSGKKMKTFLLFAGLLIGGILFEFVIWNTPGTAKNIENKSISIAFFALCALLFFIAYRLLSKGEQLEADLKNAAAIIKKYSDADSTDVYGNICNEKLFSQKVLAEAFDDYKKEVERNSVDDKLHFKADIEDYINIELIDKSISVNILNLVGSTFTGLGILGTFVGLSLGLKSFDLMGSSAELEQKIQPLMDGIKIAFHTSIYGLIYSMIYNFYQKGDVNALNTALEDFLDTYRLYVVRNTDEGKEYTVIKYQDKYLRTLERQTQKQEEQSDAQVKEMEKAVNLLDKMGDEIASKFADKMEDALIPGIDRMTTAVEDFAKATHKDQQEELKKIVEKFVEQMNTALGDSFAELGRVINQTNEWQKKSLDEMGKLLEEIGGMSLDMAKIDQSLEKSINKIEKFFKDIDALQNIVNENMRNACAQNDICIDNMNKQKEIMDDVMQAQTTIHNLMNTFTKEFTLRMDLYEAQQRRMESIKEKELILVREAAEKICNEVSQNSLEHITRLNDSVQNYDDNIDKMLDTFRRNFAETSSIVDDSIEIVKERIESTSGELMYNIEASSEQLMGKISTQHETYIKSVNDSINRMNGQLDRNLSDVVTRIKNNILSMIDLNNNIAASITDAASGLDKAANNLNSGMESSIKSTFVTFDKEISVIMRHFSGTLSQMREQIDAVPEIVNGVYGDMDDKFEQMQMKLDQYLDYTDRLQRNVEQKWQQLKDVSRRN